jgi:NodT family efflux transporter outer membrane factor (OMF) lipoprotein
MRPVPALLALALLAGCGARDEAPRSELLAGAGAAVEQPRAEFAAATPAAAATDPAAPAVTAGWLATFADAQLDTLVAEALTGSRDLAGAVARLEQAKSRARQAGADLGPTIGFAAQANGSDSTAGASSQNGGAGLSLTWEADIWGRVASGVAAEQARFQASALDYAWARESLAANVAKALFFARLCAAQEALASDTTAQLDRLVTIAQARQKIGKAAADEVARAEAAAAEAKQRQTGASAAREEAVRSLEVLLGRHPAATLDVGSTLPAVPDAPPAGLPSQLLERRPDLVAATRRVAAAFNQVESAKAARLPRLSLTAGGGVASGEFQGINAQGAFWSLAGNLLGPIYDGGRLKEQVVIEQGKQQEALAAYAQTALQAFQQVENGLGTGARLAQRRAQLATALTAREQAVKAATAKRTVGQVSDDVVIAATLDQLQTRALDLSVQHDQLATRVALHLALGGGFAAPPATPDDTAPASKAIAK